MRNEDTHLSEGDLVLAADGELPPRRRAEVAAHLEKCWNCRERMESLQNTITGFVRARNSEFAGQLPPEAGPRALLRARLAEAGACGGGKGRFSMSRMALAGAAAAAAAVAILIVFGATVNAEGPKPESGLTPGDTRPITIGEVCQSADAEVVSRDIPEATRLRVFAEYGIQSPQPNQFEVDYLITPDLGGTESVRNLWPQPYSARWNARVKDKLERKLHQLVCAGRLDLPTAQHAIATDWIAAYKKYVGGDPSR